MKTAELEGAALDYYIAKAEGLDIETIRNGSVIIGRTPNRCAYSPSTRWHIGGPIIEREGICIVRDDAASPWGAGIPGSAFADGPTPLIAAMRAYVASRFGDELADI